MVNVVVNHCCHCTVYTTKKTRNHIMKRNIIVLLCFHVFIDTQKIKEKHRKAIILHYWRYDFKDCAQMIIYFDQALRLDLSLAYASITRSRYWDKSRAFDVCRTNPFLRKNWVKSGGLAFTAPKGTALSRSVIERWTCSTSRLFIFFSFVSFFFLVFSFKKLHNHKGHITT